MIMSYKVIYSKSVVKTILKYDKPTRERIYLALNSLPYGDVKKLQDRDNPPYYRLRISSLRALFIKDDIHRQILVFDLDSRGDIYK